NCSRGQCKLREDRNKFASAQCIGNDKVWHICYATSGRTRDITFQPSVSGDTTQAVLSVVKAGGGIANMPDFIVADALRAGELVAILPEFALPSGTISAVFPPTPYRSAATRRFSEFFLERFRDQQSRSTETKSVL
ncbi:MAG: LysR substrate-binding domain-containing protein, partial [Pseudomonadota bacterium]